MKINLTKTPHILFFAGALPVSSLFASWAFYQLFPEPPFWLETVSPVFAYVLFYSLFENRIWHLKIFRLLGIVDFPDLRGRCIFGSADTFKPDYAISPTSDAMGTADRPVSTEAERPGAYKNIRR